MSGAEQTREERAEEVYLKALAACLAEDYDAADALLAEIGCTHRLSSSVWHQAHMMSPYAPAGLSEEDCRIPNDPGSPVVMAYDLPLPHNLIVDLISHFAEGFFFWQHHYGEPNTPFFSYLYNLSDPPRINVEAAAQLLLPLVQRTAASLAEQGFLGASSSSSSSSAAPQLTHMEWWAHFRRTDAPHQLHFDANELLMRRGLERYRLQHPLVSSVLYLSSHGGPTVVLQQTPQGNLRTQPQEQQQQQQQQQQQPPPSDQQMLADRAFLISPSERLFAMWPGNFLHGVLPVPPPPPFEHPDDDGPYDPEDDPEYGRVTLVMAWWDHDPRAAAMGDDAPRPNAHQPTTQKRAASSTPAPVQQQQQQQQGSKWGTVLGPMMVAPYSMDEASAEQERQAAGQLPAQQPPAAAAAAAAPPSADAAAEPAPKRSRRDGDPEDAAGSSVAAAGGAAASAAARPAFQWPPDPEWWSEMRDSFKFALSGLQSTPRAGSPSAGGHEVPEGGTAAALPSNTPACWQQLGEQMLDAGVPSWGRYFWQYPGEPLEEDTTKSGYHRATAHQCEPAWERVRDAGGRRAQEQPAGPSQLAPGGHPASSCSHPERLQGAAAAAGEVPPGVKPSAQLVGPAEAAAPAAAAGLLQAPLPCLRFFLRGAGEISQAYTPVPQPPAVP